MATGVRKGVAQLRLTPRSAEHLRRKPARRWVSVSCSGNHAALERFVGNRTGHAVEKLRPHLRVLAHRLDDFFLDHLSGSGRRLRFLFATALGRTNFDTSGSLSARPFP